MQSNFIFNRIYGSDKFLALPWEFPGAEKLSVEKEYGILVTPVALGENEEWVLYCLRHRINHYHLGMLVYSVSTDENHDPSDTNYKS